MPVPTRRMIRAYESQAPLTMFLSGFFQTPAQNFHNSEEVEVEVMRDDEEVAITVVDLSTGSRQNFADLYTNKRFKPPIFDEEFTVSSFDLIKKDFGRNPYENPEFQANLMNRMFRGFRKVDAKIRRAIELMAAQVLQTGELILRDKNGVALYRLEFGVKSSHFPTAADDWDDVDNRDPMADLENLAEVLRTNGKYDPDTLLFGRKSLDYFLSDAKVQSRLDNRRISIGTVAPDHRGNGGTWQGDIWIGNYRFDFWSYSGRYKDPETGQATPFLADDKVVMLSSQAPLDLTYGAIPRIAGAENRVAPFLPERMAMPEAGADLSTYAWLTPDGKAIKGSAGTRPLPIPRAIDTFGTLTVVS